jgi:diadenylate cyclase
VGAETIFRDLVVFLQSRSWRDVLDVIVVAFLAYRLLVLIRGTRAVQLIAGLSVLVFVGLMAKVLRLQLTYFIFSNLAPALLIGVVILFQPELRRALDRVGRVGFLGRPLAHYSLPLMGRVIDEVTRGVSALSSSRTGALIVFERTVGLENYALTGVRLNAEVSCEFIQAVFFPRSPLHDGAVIIRGNQVLAAGCLLPVSDDVTFSDRIGTRHRAALALSMESDALIVVVSEETGTVSVVQDGNLRRGVEPEALRQILHNTLLPHTGTGFGRPFNRPFNRRRATDQALVPALEGAEAEAAAAAGDGIDQPQTENDAEPAEAPAAAPTPPAAARGGTR